jgi:hypothetical protein
VAQTRKTLHSLGGPTLLPDPRVAEQQANLGLLLANRAAQQRSLGPSGPSRPPGPDPMQLELLRAAIAEASQRRQFQQQNALADQQFELQAVNRRADRDLQREQRAADREGRRFEAELTAGTRVADEQGRQQRADDTRADAAAKAQAAQDQAESEAQAALLAKSGELAARDPAALQTVGRDYRRLILEAALRFKGGKVKAFRDAADLIADDAARVDQARFGKEGPRVAKARTPWFGEGKWGSLGGGGQLGGIADELIGLVSPEKQMEVQKGRTAPLPPDEWSAGDPALAAVQQEVEIALERYFPDYKRPVRFPLPAGWNPADPRGAPAPLFGR